MAAVRDPDEARRVFGNPDGLHIRGTRLDDPHEVATALEDVRAVFMAGSGRVALIDHRDVAEAGLRVLTDPALWGTHHDLTGPIPMSWPEALELLSAELGEPVTFR